MEIRTKDNGVKSWHELYLNNFVVEWLPQSQPETRYPDTSSSSGSGSGSSSGSTSSNTGTALHLAKVDTYKTDVLGRSAYRIFREQQGPKQEMDNSGNSTIVFDNTVYDRVFLKIELEEAIPKDMKATVHLKWFDPANPELKGKGLTGASPNNPSTTIGYGKPNDNNKSVAGKTTASFQSGQSTRSASIVISSRHAGDNYIVAVHPNDGVTDNYKFYDDIHGSNAAYKGSVLMRPGTGSSDVLLDSKLQTSLLTVWRTLHVECDKLDYYNERYIDDIVSPRNSSSVTQTPSPAGYLNDFVVDQLRRACIEIAPYEFNAHQPGFTGYRPQTWYGHFDVTGTRPIQDPNNPGKMILEPNPNIPAAGSGRDMDFAWNTPDFWTIRIVTVSTIPMGPPDIPPNDPDYDKYEDNSAGLFAYGGNTILIHYQSTLDALKKWNTNYTSAHLTTAIRRTILHEIAHALIETAEGSGGVRETDLGMAERINNTDYHKFTPQHIMQIQKNSQIIG